MLRIKPAHAPAIAELTLLDRSLAVRLHIDGRSDATRLLLKGLAEPIALANGTRVEPFSTPPPPPATLLPPRHVAKLSAVPQFDEGRAGMLYRSLLCETSDSVIASHIRVPDGPVADYVHFHLVDAQIIFVVHGAATLVYCLFFRRLNTRNEGWCGFPPAHVTQTNTLDDRQGSPWRSQSPKAWGLSDRRARCSPEAGRRQTQPTHHIISGADPLSVPSTSAPEIVKLNAIDEKNNDRHRCCFCWAYPYWR